jgi:hypothetical protein
VRRRLLVAWASSPCSIGRIPMPLIAHPPRSSWIRLAKGWGTSPQPFFLSAGGCLLCRQGLMGTPNASYRVRKPKPILLLRQRQLGGHGVAAASGVFGACRWRSGIHVCHRQADACRCHPPLQGSRSTEKLSQDHPTACHCERSEAISLPRVGLIGLPNAIHRVWGPRLLRRCAPRNDIHGLEIVSTISSTSRGRSGCLPR